MFRWVIGGELARDCRSGGSRKRALSAAKGEVEEWIVAAKHCQVQSLICLLSEEQLTHYAALQTDLLAYYRRKASRSPISQCVIPRSRFALKNNFSKSGMRIGN